MARGAGLPPSRARTPWHIAGGETMRPIAWNEELDDMFAEVHKAILWDL